jgi:hypothetical protein
MAIDYSSPSFYIPAAIVLVLIVAAIAIYETNRRHRTNKFRARFGAEYDLALQEYRSRGRAEAHLQDRIHRVRRYQIRTLPEVERASFLAQWEAVQARFVDHPRGAVTEADELTNSLMKALGYPVSTGVDQRAADISVNYPRLVSSYRSANTITHRAGRNEATTEELRTAMIHYRALFEELLQLKAPVIEGQRAIA